MDAIKITFFQECDEQLAELENGLLALEAGEAGDDVVNGVFRAVHSIKGGAGAFGLDALVRFAHVFETALDELRGGRLQPDPDRVLKPMLRAADSLADLVAAARDKSAVDEDRVRHVADELAAFAPAAGDGPADDLSSISFDAAPPVQSLGFDEPAYVECAPQWIITFKPKSDLYANANEAGLILRELGRLGSAIVTADLSDLPLLELMDPEGAYLSWTIRLSTTRPKLEIVDVFEFVEGDCDVSIELAKAAGSADPGDADRRTEEEPFDVAALILRVQAEQLGTDEVAQAPAPALYEAPVSAMEPARGQPVARSEGPPAGTNAATIRVDLDRVDRLIDLVGELVINQAMLSQRVIEAGFTGGSAIGVGLDELEQLSREIQDSVMAIRAQPVKSVFQRMPRLAREVAAMTGKQVRLVTEGENTEVDKTVIERLTDPLTHMIRNAIDHGLEAPAERLRAGKPVEGTVRLSAGHRSGRIIIEVADDGAGIDRSKVREIAVSKGLLAPDASITEEEVDNLLFLPGFSTSTEVSDISGRGVGMDVVKRSIQALGGRISISSRPGQGSTFIMSLPLTLAVLDGMVVSVDDQTMVVPLTAIVETLQPKSGAVFKMGGDARVIAVRDSYVPLIDVGLVLGYRNKTMAAGDGVVLLIEGDGGARAALLVEAIQGQRQVVIKSLEANYRHVPGIAAATILGDGRVALILDVDAVVSVSRSSELISTDTYLSMVA